MIDFFVNIYACSHKTENTRRFLFTMLSLHYIQPFSFLLQNMERVFICMRLRSS